MRDRLICGILRLASWILGLTGWMLGLIGGRLVLKALFLGHIERILGLIGKLAGVTMGSMDLWILGPMCPIIGLVVPSLDL